MMLIPGARDWALLVVSFELMGIPLYALAAWAKNDGPPDRPRLAAEAGLKLFVTGTASSALTFFGLALVVGLSGSTRIDAIVDPGRVAAARGRDAPHPRRVRLQDRRGAVPHLGSGHLPGRADPVRRLPLGRPEARRHRGAGGDPPLGLGAEATRTGRRRSVLLSAASMVVGNLFALPQTDVRRLLGFSGIAQMGYVLIGLAAHTRAGLAMALFFMATYVFTNLGAFLVLHAGAEASGGHAHPAARGPVAALARCSARRCWSSCSRWPASRSWSASGRSSSCSSPAYRAGLGWLVVLGVVLAVYGLFYYLSVARSTFMAEGRGERPGADAAAAAAGDRRRAWSAVVGLGLWPRPLLEAADVAAADLLGEPVALSARR